MKGHNHLYKSKQMDSLLLGVSHVISHSSLRFYSGISFEYTIKHQRNITLN